VRPTRSPCPSPLESQKALQARDRTRAVSRVGEERDQRVTPDVDLIEDGFLVPELLVPREGDLVVATQGLEGQPMAASDARPAEG